MKPFYFPFLMLIALIFTANSAIANAGVVTIDYNTLSSYNSTFNISFTKSTLSKTKIVVKNIPDNKLNEIRILDQNQLNLSPTDKIQNDSLWTLEYSLEGAINSRQELTAFRFFSDQKEIAIFYKNEDILPKQNVRLNGTNDLYEYASQVILDEYEFNRYYSTEKGLYIKNNVVHIFLDEDGEYILTSIPTTVQENYTYKFVLFYNKNCGYKYTFTFEGEYNPLYNIREFRNGNGNYASVSDDKPTHEKAIKLGVKETTFGPATDKFVVKLSRTKITTKVQETVMKQQINVAKRYYVSLVAGLYATALKNPKNIKPFVLANGDTTLVAEDPSTRRVVTLMAVYYPVPRTFLFEPSYLSVQRVGILLGTQIEKDQFENIFFGLQYELARGLGLAGGMHYGRHWIIADNEEFVFGEDKFTGDLEESLIQQWDFSYFFGVNLDLRVVQQFITGDDE